MREERATRRTAGSERAAAIRRTASRACERPFGAATVVALPRRNERRPALLSRVTSYLFPEAAAAGSPPLPLSPPPPRNRPPRPAPPTPDDAA